MGSLFAGCVLGYKVFFAEGDAKYGYSWMMHKTGRYRMLTLICGIFPFVSAVMIATMREDSHPLLQWLSIVRHNVLKDFFALTVRLSVPSRLRQRRRSANHAQ